MPGSSKSSPLYANFLAKQLGLADYKSVWQAMRFVTDQRPSDELNQVRDQVWQLQHYPVFTLGQAGKKEHIISTSEIPIVQSDRGGQVTYHGPGQLVCYTLFDLKRMKIGIKRMVYILEEAVIQCLHDMSILAQRISGAPGVYVDSKKIAALGLRVRNGCTYHGVALNVAMDLAPYNLINPCGYENMQVIDVYKLNKTATLQHCAEILLHRLDALLELEKSC